MAKRDELEFGLFLLQVERDSRQRADFLRQEIGVRVGVPNPGQIVN